MFEKKQKWLADAKKLKVNPKRYIESQLKKERKSI